MIENFKIIFLNTMIVYYVHANEIKSCISNVRNKYFITTNYTIDQFNILLLNYIDFCLNILIRTFSYSKLFFFLFHRYLLSIIISNVICKNWKN